MQIIRAGKVLKKVAQKTATKETAKEVLKSSKSIATKLIIVGIFYELMLYMQKLARANGEDGLEMGSKMLRRMSFFVKEAIEEVDEEEARAEEMMEAME